MKKICCPVVPGGNNMIPMILLLQVHGMTITVPLEICESIAIVLILMIQFEQVYCLMD